MATLGALVVIAITPRRTNKQGEFRVLRHPYMSPGKAIAAPSPPQGLKTAARIAGIQLARRRIVHILRSIGDSALRGRIELVAVMALFSPPRPAPCIGPYVRVLRIPCVLSLIEVMRPPLCVAAAEIACAWC